MIIGVAAERTRGENRVLLAPTGARVLAERGHIVLVESGAGAGCRFRDDDYREAGARVVYDRDNVLERADLLLQVAPLHGAELQQVLPGQAVLAFHHLAAASRATVEGLLARAVTAIGLERIEDPTGDLPVLHAMSEIAGQLAIHVAAHYLETRAGGRGILLGGSPGIPPAHVVIVGAGQVGLWAARLAIGNGAQVTLIDSGMAPLRRAEETLGHAVVTQIAHPQALARAVAYADVLIGAVLVRGARSPQIITRGMVRTMKPGAVIVDVSIDQGGCVETSRPTTLDQPIYVEHGVTHYCVPNMASAVARTASLALTCAALPYIQALADHGVDAAARQDPGLAAAFFTHRGDLVSEAVAGAFGMPWRPLAAVPAAAPAGTMGTAGTGTAAPHAAGFEIGVGAARGPGGARPADH
jgi:alanine dehydrogenase